MSSDTTYNGKTYEYFTLENKGDFIALYGWGTYPAHSVLAGQASKSYLTSFETVEEAMLSHPEVEFSQPLMEREISLNHLSDEEGSW